MTDASTHHGTSRRTPAQQGQASVMSFPGHTSGPTAVGTVQGALALDLTPRLEPPRPALRAAGAWDLVQAVRKDRERLDAFAARFFQAVTEIAVGDRPLTQVLRHCVPGVYSELSRRAHVVSAAAGTSLQTGRGRSRVRPQLVGVRTSLVLADALEACAHVRYGERSRAIAGRFEIVRGRWQCVTLEWS